MPIDFCHSAAPVLSPHPECPWASKMVLNPAILADPDDPRTIHMLFRATGPWPQGRRPGRPDPFPIFLGYAVSRDEGRSWQADFSKPALAPALADAPDALWVEDEQGGRMPNYANGCIEDPRLFSFEGSIHLSVACRMFPPGPYWQHDDPMQCAPEWAAQGEHGLGLAASANITVSVLFRVDLDALNRRDYAAAFVYRGPLHDPERGDNRDVFLFPRKLRIDGRWQVVCVHRPKEPWRYEEGHALSIPSIFLAAADTVEALSSDRARQHVLAQARFDWEANRIGGSFPPIELGGGEWLLAYHGKQDDQVGYTQSFMILREQATGFPIVAHRCSERLLCATLPWELQGDFTIPCLFTCGGVRLVDGSLLMSYGAADSQVGLVQVDCDKLVDHIRRFDAQGRPIS